MDLIPSYPENTDALDQYLQANEDDGLEETLEMDLETGDVMPKKNLMRKREIFDEIVVQKGPQPSGFRGRNL